MNLLSSSSCDFTKNSNRNKKHNQQTFKKQFRSFPYDFTKNSNRITKNITNRLSKSNYVVFHIILLKTATETQKNITNRLSKSNFVVLHMILLRTATETKNSSRTATETQKHNQHTVKKQFRSFPYDFTKNTFP